MNKPSTLGIIKINILPAELKEVKIREQRKALIVTLSVLMLGIMVLITAGLLLAVVIQKSKIDHANSDLTKTQGNVSSFKDQEALALILKSRIDGVNAILKKEFPQSEAFTLINTITPSDINITSFSVGRTSEITLQGESSSISSVDTFFNTLVDPKFNDGKIAQATLQSLNRSIDKKIKFELTLTLVGAGTSKPAIAPPPKT